MDFGSLALPERADQPTDEANVSGTLTVGSGIGISNNLTLTEVIKHFEKGFGDVLSFVGIVIGLGAMLGGILISSGGAA